MVGVAQEAGARRDERQADAHALVHLGAGRGREEKKRTRSQYGGAAKKGREREWCTMLIFSGRVGTLSEEREMMEQQQGQDKQVEEE